MLHDGTSGNHTTTSGSTFTAKEFAGPTVVDAPRHMDQLAIEDGSAMQRTTTSGSTFTGRNAAGPVVMNAPRHKDQLVIEDGSSMNRTTTSRSMYTAKPLDVHSLVTSIRAPTIELTDGSGANMRETSSRASYKRFLPELYQHVAGVSQRQVDQPFGHRDHAFEGTTTTGSTFVNQPPSPTKSSLPQQHLKLLDGSAEETVTPTSQSAFQSYLPEQYFTASVRPQFNHASADIISDLREFDSTTTTGTAFAAQDLPVEELPVLPQRNRHVFRLVDGSNNAGTAGGTSSARASYQRYLPADYNGASSRARQETGANVLGATGMFDGSTTTASTHTASVFDAHVSYKSILANQHRQNTEGRV